MMGCSGHAVREHLDKHPWALPGGVCMVLPSSQLGTVHRHQTYMLGPKEDG